MKFTEGVKAPKAKLLTNVKVTYPGQKKLERKINRSLEKRRRETKKLLVVSDSWRIKGSGVEEKPVLCN